jgi:NAD(P)-dependent dehydrogenase (short-subunit alcohol dehydrogenase family)
VDIARKTGLVTGAGAGIGNAIALRLAAAGAVVVVADTDEEAGTAAVDQIVELGGKASFVRADVTQVADVEAMIADAERIGGLDILVNNVGGYEDPVFPDAPIEHWMRNLDLNLRSAMLGIHFSVRAMKDRGGGSIVNVASTAGLGLSPHPGPEYAAAKAGIVRLTACLAPLADQGIRVNCVCPYTVATPTVRRTITDLQARGEELPPPLKATLLEPEEVADAAFALIADESMAGRVLLLIGGQKPKLLSGD